MTGIPSPVRLLATDPPSADRFESWTEYARIMTSFTEDELVAAVRRLLSTKAAGVILGVGDDAALVEFGPHLGVLTTDLLVEGIHFERGVASARDLGYKALTVNVSDVAAMGGSPRYGLVSLGLPQGTELPWVVELYGGLLEAAGEYGMSIVGGDTNRSAAIIVSVAVAGEAPRGAAVARTGARPGERIVVTGTLGAAAGGLRLSRGHPGNVSDSGRTLFRALARPVARVGEGQTLAQSGATAMIDVSDGLARDLGRLALESGVGAAVRLEDVPVDPALFDVGLDGDPLELALHGGEDYELVATLPSDSVEGAADRMWDRFGTRLTEIGEIREGSGLLAVDPSGAMAPLEPKGWDHFGG
jgi:thiamine-monophosphate kinase